MQQIGTVVRLQVQRSSPKMGEKPRRWYDPAPLVVVEALSIAPAGVVGLVAQGERLVDVHHRDHPASKNQDVNAVSVGFTAHYARMRERFGEHLVEGVAGENILVQAEQSFVDDALQDGLVIETRDGQRLALERIMVAEPCVEFTRYALQLPRDAPSDGAVAEALEFLRHGTRGFYASYAGAPVTVRAGDRVFLA